MMKQVKMDCLVVGGIADGLLLRGVECEADAIRLQRPTHLKPLAAPNQDEPEAAVESEDYYIIPFLCDTDNKDVDIQVGIAIPMTSNMWEAFHLIITKYIRATMEELRQDDQPLTLKKH